MESIRSATAGSHTFKIICRTRLFNPVSSYSDGPVGTDLDIPYTEAPCFKSISESQLPLNPALPVMRIFLPASRFRFIFPIGALILQVRNFAITLISFLIPLRLPGTLRYLRIFYLISAAGTVSVRPHIFRSLPGYRLTSNEEK